jgi:hypothetical protein
MTDIKYPKMKVIKNFSWKINKKNFLYNRRQNENNMNKEYKVNQTNSYKSSRNQKFVYVGAEQHVGDSKRELDILRKHFNKKETVSSNQYTFNSFNRKFVNSKPYRFIKKKNYAKKWKTRFLSYKQREEKRKLLLTKYSKKSRKIFFTFFKVYTILSSELKSRENMSVIRFYLYLYLLRLYTLKSYSLLYKLKRFNAGLYLYSNLLKSMEFFTNDKFYGTNKFYPSKKGYMFSARPSMRKPLWFLPTLKREKALF